jgi:hypothetical protein
MLAWVRGEETAPVVDQFLRAADAGEIEAAHELD